MSIVHFPAALDKLTYDPRSTPFPRGSTLDLLWRTYHPRLVVRGGFSEMTIPTFGGCWFFPPATYIVDVQNLNTPNERSEE